MKKKNNDNLKSIFKQEEIKDLIQEEKEQLSYILPAIENVAVKIRFYYDALIEQALTIVISHGSLPGVYQGKL